MSEAAWTGLAGVLLGGLIGQIGQYLTDRRRDQTASRERLRDARLAAFAELIAAESAALGLATRMQGSKAAGLSEAKRLEMLIGKEDAFSRLNAAVGQVAMVSSPDTRNAAVDVMQAVIDLALDKTDERALLDARNNFVTLAQREAGTVST